MDDLDTVQNNSGYTGLLPDSPTIPLNEVAQIPAPGMSFPADLAFSPDDYLVTYLYSPERSLTRQLFAFDIQSGQHKLLVTPPGGGTTEENVSPEEALRRERMRQLEVGVTQYAWSKQGERLLIPAQGSIYISDEPFSPLRCLWQSQAKPALDARFSPDSLWVAFVLEAELYVISTNGGEARQLTSGARQAGKTHGLAEYIAQEEMDRRNGYWWSPDSRWLAFEEVDELHIPIYRIVHQGKDTTGESSQEDHRYPFAGQPNARVRLGVVSVDGGEPIWMDLGPDEDIYLARVDWLPNGQLIAQIENRQQTCLDILVFDPQTGQAKHLLQETSTFWINLHNMFYALKQPYQGQEGYFIWASERTGFRHLYLIDQQGVLIRPLTSGAWMVDALVAVDESNERLYFTATLDSPLESHLYMVPFTGGKPMRLTTAPGTHTIVIDHAHQRFLDTYQSIDQPPFITLRSLKDGSWLKTIHEERDPRIDALQLKAPEIISLRNRQDELLYGAIYRPPARFGSGPYPTLVLVYGGPHAQQVVNSWLLTARMRVQYLRSLGFLVFVLDNRGSARRGLLFEGAIKNDMGHLEVEDQVDGVKWLIDLGLADPQRVGIFGWSYGGYMSAMCLARAPEIFKASVAGAPVSAWDGYDTHYTERYMGTPQSNPQGYETSSVMHHIDKMTGKLMLVHGLIDENVHFRHTARLINTLIATRKTYELLLFPNERHSPRRLADRIYMEERIRDFFLGAFD